jgi:hypothetical protein
MNDEEESGEQKEKEKEKKKSTNPSSAGAYMLVYTMVKYFKDQEKRPDPEIPTYLVELINEEDSKFEEEFTRTKLEKESEVKRKSERQAEVDMLFKHRIPVESENEDEENVVKKKPKKMNSGKKPGNNNVNTNLEDMEVDDVPASNQNQAVNFDFISIEWLEKWLKVEIVNPPPVENEKIICPHRKLDPPKRRDLTALYKVVPTDFVSPDLFGLSFVPFKIRYIRIFRSHIKLNAKF